MTLAPRSEPAPLAWPVDQPKLAGTSVVLRPWSTQDAAEVQRACQDPEIQRWTTVPSPYTSEDAWFFVEICAVLWTQHDGAPFAVASPIDDQVLGSCGVVGLDEARRVGEVGYWVAPWARQRGVATDALDTLSAWALDQVGFSILELVIDPANVASVRAAEKANYRLEDNQPSLRVPDFEPVVLRRRA
jgi:RimJ/RimL family protein N-acetyltransferase